MNPIKSEAWAPVIGFESNYEISNFGNLRSLDREINSSHGKTRVIKGAIKKLKVNHNGYLVAELYKHNKRIGKVVHLLVAEAFLPQVADKLFINHKNGVKSDNRLDNLEWCNRSENMHHAYSENLIVGRNSGETHNRAILNEDLVIQIKNFLNDGYRPCDIARMLKIRSSAIYSIRKGETWKQVLVPNL